MKNSNNKGFTLIESIIAIAVISIILSALALALSTVIRYMAESKIIADTSTALLEQIQGDISQLDHESAMIYFDEDTYVTGEMYSVSENYSNNSNLSFSYFKSNNTGDSDSGMQDQETIKDSKLVFKVLESPLYVNNENQYLIESSTVFYDAVMSTPFINKDKYEADALDLTQFIVLGNTDKTEYQEMQTNLINQILRKDLNKSTNQQIYCDFASWNKENYTADLCEIVWYKIQKNNETYEVYGYVKPTNHYVCVVQFLNQTSQVGFLKEPLIYQAFYSNVFLNSNSNWTLKETGVTYTSNSYNDYERLVDNTAVFNAISSKNQILHFQETK